MKGYIRKGAALWAMHEWSRAHRAYEDALAIDPSSAEAQEGLRQLDVNHNVKLAVVQVSFYVDVRLSSLSSYTLIGHRVATARGTRFYLCSV